MQKFSHQRWTLYDFSFLSYPILVVILHVINNWCVHACLEDMYCGCKEELNSYVHIVDKVGQNWAQWVREAVCNHS